MIIACVRYGTNRVENTKLNLEEAAHMMDAVPLMHLFIKTGIEEFNESE